MKNRTITIPNRTAQTIRVWPDPPITNIYPGVLTRETFTVLQDNVHGDHKSDNNHEFRKTVENFDVQGVYYSYTPTFELTQVGSISPPDNRPVDDDFTFAFNNAVSSLYDQLRYSGVGTGLDLSVDLAEQHQVRQMLRNVSKLTSYVRSFHPKRWASKWLEYQYGWRPLVNSVYGSFSALMHRRIYAYQRIISRGYDNSSDSGNSPFLIHAGLQSHWTVDMKKRVLIKALYQTGESRAQALAGYTSLNPVSIAWELTPYSFVVDWLVDIGGYLQSMESALLYGQSFRGGCVVYGYKHYQTTTVTGSWRNSPTSYGYAVGQSFFSRSYKRRSVLGSTPFPTFPRFQANLGWQRVLSGASLIAQHLGR